MYNFFLEKIILPIGDIFNRSSYIKQLKYWREVDGYSEKQLEELQTKNLFMVLEHARESVPYYKASISQKKDLRLNDFPIIDKNVIRNDTDKLISNKHNKNQLIPYSSSGSSGVQTTVYMTKQEQSILRGVLTHWWEWTGYRAGKPLIQTGMAPQRSSLKSLKDFLFKTKYVYAFSFTDEELKVICDGMQKKNNHYYLAGYASSLNVIAEFALKHNYDIKLNGVVSLGDKLFSHYRKNVEKAFSAKVLDTYGSNEGFMIATQDDNDYYYILSPHVYVEILDENNQPVPDGTMGHIIVTRLDCFSMPLIRYRIGDLGVKLPREEYPEKRKYNYPLLKQVVGRETDVVILPDDRKLIVHSFTGIFEYIPEIKQFKVIQEDKTGIIIEYVKGDNFTEKALEKAEKELRNKINDNHFSIGFQRVDYIPPTKSGKPKIVESRIK